MAKPFVLSGAPFHASGGETFWAFFLNFCAISDRHQTLETSTEHPSILRLAGSAAQRYPAWPRSAPRRRPRNAWSIRRAAAVGRVPCFGDWARGSGAAGGRRTQARRRRPFHLVHGGLQSGGTLVFALPVLSLRGEVEDHGVGTIVVAHMTLPNASDETMPTCLGSCPWFSRPFRFGATALHYWTEPAVSGSP